MMNLVGQVSLLHPALAAAGLLAGGIPIVIHLINRRRHRKVPWAAMIFLQQAVRRRARRLRLEQWLLLAIRAGMLIFLGLALARPIFSPSKLLAVGQARAHRMVLIDNSGSMGASAAGGTTAFEEARKAAMALIDSLPATDAVSIVSLAAPASTVLGYASFDRREARDRLALLPLTQRATDLAGGFRLAEAAFKESPAAAGNRIVYVLSDMAASSWSQGGDLKTSAAIAAAQRLGEGAAIVLAPVGAPERVPDAANVAVSKLEAAPGAVAVKVPVRFTAEVSNYGTEEVREAVLQIRRDERIERRLALPRLGPGARETLNFLVEFDAAGTYGLAAHVDTTPPDALALDNDRYLSVHVAASVPVLLVGGTQSGGGISSETAYLATALNPWRDPQGTGLIAPKTISDLELGGEVLSEFRVIALCNVARLEEGIWERLSRFVESGGGLLVFAGDVLNVEHYNKFGYRGGAGVLPGTLSPAVGEAGGTGGLSFKGDEFAHPIVAEFAGNVGSGLFSARVERYAPIAPASAAETALRYANGQPAIALIRRGAGQCCFVTTTANMAWTNLPARGDFVSLAMNLVTYLSQPAGRTRNLEVGEPIVRRLTAEEASLPMRVQLPSGETVEAAVTVVSGAAGDQEKGLSLRFEGTEQIGFYRTVIGSGAGAAGGVEGVAVNPPPLESDLRAVDEAELARAVTMPFTYARNLSELTGPGGLAAVREVGPEALYLVLGLLLVETWLAMRFGSNR